MRPCIIQLAEVVETAPGAGRHVLDRHAAKAALGQQFGGRGEDRPVRLFAALRPGRGCSPVPAAVASVIRDTLRSSRLGPEYAFCPRS
jgi:hypothetical protein